MTCDHFGKRYKLFSILFLVLWSVPQTNSSMEEAITSQSSIRLVAFHGGFLQNRQKTGFIQKLPTKESNGFPGGQ